VRISTLRPSSRHLGVAVSAALMRASLAIAKVGETTAPPGQPQRIAASAALDCSKNNVQQGQAGLRGERSEGDGLQAALTLSTRAKKRIAAA
jgi:hypothetical protein